jgi:hypothetical protein
MVEKVGKTPRRAGFGCTYVDNVMQKEYIHKINFNSTYQPMSDFQTHGSLEIPHASVVNLSELHFQFVIKSIMSSELWY